MGAWGAGIYQDDVALDVKEEYIELLKKGKSKEEANQEIIDNNTDYLEDEEDMVPMILALADTQWNYGRLMKEVKENALNLINSGEALKPWEDDKKLKKRRMEVLEKLKNKLETPEPPEKKVRKYKFFDCGWQLNDVYAYPLTSEYAKKYNVYNHWMIFIVCGDYVWENHYRSLIVRAKITKDEKLPTTKEEIDKLDYIQVGFENYNSLYGDSFSKLSDWEYKKSIKGLVEKYGEIPIYEIELSNSSKRVMPKSLQYLGNMPDIKLPEYEYIEPYRLSVWGPLWKNLEEYVLEDYAWFNLGHRYDKK